MRTKLLTTGLIILTLLLVALPSSTFARNPIPEEGNYEVNVFKPAINSPDVNLQSTVYEILLSVIAGLNQIVWCSEQITSNCEILNLPNNQQNNSPNFTNTTGSRSNPNAVANGVIPSLMRLNTQMLGHRPVSSSTYIAAVQDDLNLGASPAYAQGIGFEGLQPIYAIWEAFRNISYLIASIGFIVLSFMVMFRISAGGQAVITAQSAIIKFVIVVLAITFSYAIAGFVIDLIYLLISLIIMLYRSAGLIDVGVSLQQFQSNLFSNSIFQILPKLFGIGGDTSSALDSLSNNLWNAFTAGQGTIGTENETIAQKIFGATVENLGKLIIGFAIIYSFFRLLIQLLFAYIEIILLVIIAPFLLMMDILPGGNSFFTWLRRIFANAMVFPASVFMIITGLAIVGGQTTFGFNTALITDEVSGISLPFLTFDTATLGQLIGVGIILIIPKVNDMVKNALKVSGNQYISSIGQSVGVGMAPVTGVAGVGVRGARQYGEYQVDNLNRAARDATAGSNNWFAKRAHEALRYRSRRRKLEETFSD